MDIDVTIVIQLLIIIGLLLLLNAILFKRMLSVFEQRHLETEGALKETERLQKLIEAAQQDLQSRLRDALREVRQTREQFRVQGREQERNIIATVRTQVNERLVSTRKEMSDIEQQIRGELDQDVMNIAKLLVTRAQSKDLPS